MEKWSGEMYVWIGKVWEKFTRLFSILRQLTRIAGSLHPTGNLIFKIAGSIVYFDHLVYVSQLASVNQCYAKKWTIVALFFALQNLNQPQQQKPGWKNVFKPASLLNAFYSKCPSPVRSLPSEIIQTEGTLKLFTKQDLTLPCLHCNLYVCSFFPEIVNSSLVKFTTSILLEWWLCLFYHLFNDSEVQVDLNYNMSASNSLGLSVVLET